MESFSGFPRGRRDAIAFPPDPSAAARLTSRTRGPGALAPRPNPVLAAPALQRTGDPGALASRKGAQPGSLGSSCGALHTYCRTGARGLTKAESPGLPAWLRGGASPGRGNDKFVRHRWPVGSERGRRSREVPSTALSTLGRQPWGPRTARWLSFLGQGAGCCARCAEASRSGAAPPASPPGQPPCGERTEPSLGLLRLLASVAALSVASQGKGGNAEGRPVPRWMRPPPPLRLRRLAGMKRWL